MAFFDETTNHEDAFIDPAVLDAKCYLVKKLQGDNNFSKISDEKETYVMKNALRTVSMNFKAKKEPS